MVAIQTINLVFTRSVITARHTQLEGSRRGAAHWVSLQFRKIQANTYLKRIRWHHLSLKKCSKLYSSPEFITDFMPNSTQKVVFSPRESGHYKVGYYEPHIQCSWANILDLDINHVNGSSLPEVETINHVCKLRSLSYSVGLHNHALFRWVLFSRKSMADIIEFWCPFFFIEF